MKPHILLAVLAAVASSASGQHAERSLPSDPTVAVPSSIYQSVFKGYASFKEEVVRPWRELNDEAARGGRHGGIFSHRSHAPTEQSIPEVRVPDRTTGTPAETTPLKAPNHSHKGY